MKKVKDTYVFNIEGKDHEVEIDYYNKQLFFFESELMSLEWIDFDEIDSIIKQEEAIIESLNYIKTLIK